jgi:hypothetical protein
VAVTKPSRRTRVLIVTILGVVLAVTGCTSGTTGDSSNPRSSGGSVIDPTQPATVYRDQAVQLITDIAHAVSPGATVPDVDSDGAPWVGPTPCDKPLQGLVYWSVDRDFDAPEGKTGADLIPAVAEQLREHGFSTSGLEQTAGWASVRASTKYVGLLAMGDPNGRTVRIGIDARCGLPAPDGGDPGTGSVTPSPAT